ncbi:MAG: 8-oxo-dGTP diphosphatase MutT [Halioglobus sp.]
MSLIHVAVGVIIDADNRILIARRNNEAHQGGLWEFPGGKVEAQETIQTAMARELHEELGIDIGSLAPLLEVRHDYGDKHVLLDVHVVRSFSGEPEGREGQPLKWVSAGELPQFDFPAANVPIVEAVQELLGS